MREVHVHGWSRQWVIAMVFAACLILVLTTPPCNGQQVQQKQPVPVAVTAGGNGNAAAVNKGQAGQAPGAIRPTRQLTEREQAILRERERHEQFHREHAGHEAMHAEMLLILFATLIVGQIVLVVWRRKHFASYQAVTLLGLWLFPLGFSVLNEIWKMFGILAAFSVALGFVVFKATRRPLPPSTPRLVYTFFFAVHKFTSFASVGGYIVAMVDFFLAPALSDDANERLLGFGLIVLFYALYFGVLGRDMAEFSARTMASTIGYYSPDKLPNKSPGEDVCAVCGNEIVPFEESGERNTRLGCGHHFHDFCIRGWCIVGKKEICPYCKEKVDLKRMFPSPWTRTDVMYSQVLDGLRYLVVWYPIIVSGAQVIIWSLGLK